MPKKKSITAPGETLLGFFFLAILILIGASVYLEQFRFYPALQDRGTRSPQEKQTEASAPLKARESLFSRMVIPEGIESLSEPETFDASKVSDKINGKAELYLNSGFLRLETRRFSIRGEAGVWIEMFVYQMNDPQGAFSVFSQQKRGDAIPAEIGPMSYYTQNALFLAHGPYYLELIASSETPLLKEVLSALGKAFTTAFRTTQEPAEKTTLFPKEGLNPESIVLIAADAFGFEKLNRVFTADYTIDGVFLSAFVSPRADPEEAGVLAEAYRDFLLQFEAEVLEAGLFSEEGIQVYSIMGGVEVFFSQGLYFAGIHQAADKESALTLARNLKKYLIHINETY